MSSANPPQKAFSSWLVKTPPSRSAITALTCLTLTLTLFVSHVVQPSVFEKLSATLEPELIEKAMPAITKIRDDPSCAFEYVRAQLAPERPSRPKH